MHPNNKLIRGYNFLSLVEEFPLLKPFLVRNEFDKPTLDFGSQACVLLFNRALLKKYYGIHHWTTPSSNLCPTVPGRADYLHYLSDIIGVSSKKILDIGTGASLIYPLLGLVLFNWHFVATDIDEDSLTHAKHILSDNQIPTDQIELRWQPNPASIFQGIVQPKDIFDACICNPPFFESAEQALRWHQKKWKKEASENIGTKSELIYKGGERAFITNMIQESSSFQEQIKLFSCLVSKKSNIPFIETACMNAKVKSLQFVPMKTGRKVSRIAIWDF